MHKLLLNIFICSLPAYNELNITCGQGRGQGIFSFNTQLNIKLKFSDVWGGGTKQPSGEGELVSEANYLPKLTRKEFVGD